jgi:hypothetical protein
MRPEDRNDWAVEDQYQFNRPSDEPSQLRPSGVTRQSAVDMDMCTEADESTFQKPLPDNDR